MHVLAKEMYARFGLPTSSPREFPYYQIFAELTTAIRNKVNIQMTC